MESTIYRNHMSQLKQSNLRYRRFAGFLLTLVCVLIFVLVFTKKTAGSYDGYNETYQSVMVTPGDTLWSLAEDYKMPGTSTRRFVKELKHINAMKKNDLKYGDFIIVPVYVSYQSLMEADH